MAETRDVLLIQVWEHEVDEEPVDVWIGMMGRGESYAYRIEDPEAKTPDGAPVVQESGFIYPDIMAAVNAAMHTQIMDNMGM